MLVQPSLTITHWVKVVYTNNFILLEKFITSNFAVSSYTLKILGLAYETLTNKFTNCAEELAANGQIDWADPKYLSWCNMNNTFTPFFTENCEGSAHLIDHFFTRVWSFRAFSVDVLSYDVPIFKIPPRGGLPEISYSDHEAISANIRIKIDCIYDC